MAASDRGWSMDPEDMVQNIAGLWRDVDGLRPAAPPSEEELNAVLLRWNSLPAGEREKNVALLVMALAMRDRGLKRAFYQLLELEYKEE